MKILIMDIYVIVLIWNFMWNYGDVFNKVIFIRIVYDVILFWFIFKYIVCIVLLFNL